MKDLLNELREIKELLALSQPIFSLRQFCKFADISLDHGYKLTSTGKIRFYRPFGKKIYIEREEAINTLKQHPVENTAAINEQFNHYIIKQQSYDNN